MPTIPQIERYISETVGKGKKTHVSYFGPLAEYEQQQSRSKKAKSIKTLGYGIPYLVVYSVGGKRVRESIISTMRIGHGFGHDFRADRADNMILIFDTWNNLPKHCKVQDLAAFKKDESGLISLGQAGEFFILRPKVEGTEYYKDLDRIFESGKLFEYDLPRAKALAEYLVSIHSIRNTRKEESELYVRKIRDTVGHGECIFGLADSYPSTKMEFLAEGELESIEKKCVEHRWRLKKMTSRLSKVHGDFHPWNILFSKTPKKPTDFLLLDRSRGEWGEPADDVCALSINYIFYSLRKYGKLEAEFEKLYGEFMNAYLEETKDRDILDAMPLFYAFRSLVIASPVWYPSLSVETRRKIFNFTQSILDSGRFDPTKVNSYIR